MSQALLAEKRRVAAAKLAAIPAQVRTAPKEMAPQASNTLSNQRDGMQVDDTGLHHLFDSVILVQCGMKASNQREMAGIRQVSIVSLVPPLSDLPARCLFGSAHRPTQPQAWVQQDQRDEMQAVK